MPLPNTLLMDPATGRVNLPEPCGEQPGSPAAQLRAALNQLDGFGTWKPNLVATTSEPVDPASLEGRVFLVRLADEEGALAEAEFEGAVPIDVAVGTSVRAVGCSGSVEAPNLTIVPRVPLRGSSTYGVILLDGIETERGARLEPAATWALVRQQRAPVRFGSGEPPEVLENRTPFDPTNEEELAALQGLDRLWRAHEPLLAAVDRAGPALVPEAPPARQDILLAWAFDTQTIDDPFDQDVSGSPAAALGGVSDELVLPPPLAGEGAPLTVEAFFAGALPEASCAALGCDSIGAIYARSEISAAPEFTAPSFLAGDDCAVPPGAPPGPFDDPLEPSVACERQLPLLIALPRQLPGPTGYGTVVFGHGLGRSKEDLLALAGTFAQLGFASVAFDAVDHGGRAVQISTDAALGCDGAGPGRPCAEEFGPTCAPQCFAPLLSANLPATRDHLRQTVLEQLQLERVLAACSAPGACGAFHVDGQRIAYVGQSLGALIGGVTGAVSRSMRAAVLSVGGADWVQVFTETETPDIRCPLVDALIASGVISGQPWDSGENADATCLGEDWKGQRPFLEFAAAARWLLDPVDPVNYGGHYARPGAPSVLLAEVVSDPVVPNSATATFGAVLRLSPSAASVATSASPAPSPAAARAGSSWIRYESIPADASTMFPGNAYGHGSLLAPAEPGPGMGAESGQLGTRQMQSDVLEFLVSHL